MSPLTKKNASLVNLREDAEEFQPPIPKGCLLRRVSLESLAVPASWLQKLQESEDVQSHQDELNFWTRYPQHLLQWGSDQYKKQQHYLRAMRKQTDPHTFRLKSKKKSNDSLYLQKTKENNSIRWKKYACQNHEFNGACGDSKMTLGLTSFMKNEDEGWLLPVTRFTSSTLANQLIMAHKQLFLKISALDLARAQKDKGSCRTPSLRTLIFFSQKISCVVANCILQEQDVQRRARVIGKFMSIAYNCHSRQSQMSAEAVLIGLHCPAIYRLQKTWGYVRKHHASNYRRFEDLSRRYYDCREPLYQKTYDDMVQVPPFLPSISLLIAVLTGRLSEPPQVQSFKFSSTCSELCHRTDTLHLSSSATSRTDSSLTSVKRFLSAIQLRLNPPLPSTSAEDVTCHSSSHAHSAPREDLLENLDLFFAPVSEAPSGKVLQDLEYFLECHQASATRYQMPINKAARAFLLLSRHPDMQTLYKQSILIES
ncbi:uncharacterized protein LOC128993103 [Macrosteles quadrilineatus]|uniref:uncharacterized protein LOC128993103 n=1 Tax=Macrosteles quadrilineatus TaxID=74068 RepID=UPI0023E0DD8D|nr:uncharacterized protein LOC128993103 [Macrosteles quadrilineatus]